MKRRLSKIVVVLGPTASGKTDLGIQIAKRFNGEVISADSRQVYRGMDIGTAKPECAHTAHSTSQIAGSDRRSAIGDLRCIVEGVRHHLIDVVDPDEAFSVADWKRMAIEVIRDVLRRGKTPIVVGGTGLYIQALVDNIEPPAVAPNPTLRATLEKKSLPDLVAMLKRYDPDASKRVDLNNPRRVIRALEVAVMTGQPFLAQRKKGKPLFDVLQIGIDIPRAELYRRIDERVDEQVRAGLVDEVRTLVDRFGPELPAFTAIGYRQIVAHLLGKATLSEAVQRITFDTHAFARRQMTWFRRDTRIHWIKQPDETVRLVEEFLG